MPRLTIPSILSQCETWVASNPCPKNEDGESRIAHWVYRAACAFRLRRLSAETAHSLIERSMNRLPRPGEIEQALAKTYSQPITNGSGKKQPDEPILKQDVMSRFLRNLINPVLHETGVLLIWIHHISKPSKNANGQENSAEQNKYAGLGSSELQNACREVMTLSELGEGKFCLEFTKRGRRFGLRDGNGSPIRKLNIEHHKDGIVWVKSSGGSTRTATPNTKNQEPSRKCIRFFRHRKERKQR